MKYELIKTTISPEYPMTIDILDENDVVIGQEASEENYYVILTLGIKPTDGIAPEFSKDIKVVSSNSLTGHQVDEQREQVVADFIANINS